MNHFSIFSIYYFIDRNHDFQLFLILGETNLIKEGTSLLLLLLGNKTFQIELYLYNNYNVRKVKVFVSSSIFFQAPETGDYTFFVASDDESELWISTDEASANARKIIGLYDKWTHHNQWDKYVFLKEGDMHCLI